MMKNKTEAFLSCRLSGSYTLEAAFVFSIILFTVMILLGEAFSVCSEAGGKLSTHEEVEYERHLIANIGEKEITRRREGKRWSTTVTLPVFRPEDSLRAWSLAEGENKP